jgi:tetratricopeptide (TPR) repeat protein
MPKIPLLRSFVIQLLALLRDLSHKMIAGKGRMKKDTVSYLLRRASAIDDTEFAGLLAGVEGTPAEAAVGTACFEALAALTSGPLPPAYRDEIEMEILAISRACREVFTRAALLSTTAPPRDEYPRPGDVEPARWQARELLAPLKEATPDQRSEVVRVSLRLQTWACAEAAAEASVEAASRDLKEAGAWARLGVEIADLVPGPEGWTNRLKGFTAAHVANVLKAEGELKAADAAFRPARKLWLAGSDPDQILDPGRLLDLEAALRRAQRRFDEALSLLEKARGVSRCPAHTLISKGFTLEGMGEYQKAIEALLEAEPLLDRHAEPRIWYKQRFNLAVNFCHTSRYREAAALVAEAGPIIVKLKDEIDYLRLAWLRSRIEAGLGRPTEALRLLEHARRGFASRNMQHDVALAQPELEALSRGKTPQPISVIN